MISVLQGSTGGFRQPTTVTIEVDGHGSPPFKEVVNGIPHPGGSGRYVEEVAECAAELRGTLQTGDLAERKAFIRSFVK